MNENQRKAGTALIIITYAVVIILLRTGAI